MSEENDWSLAEIKRLRLAVASGNAKIHMAVARLGGLVEGRPTISLNFLQRIDELREIEREAERLRAARSPSVPAAMVQCITGDWHAFEDGGDAHRFRDTWSHPVYQIVTVQHWTWHPASRPDAAGKGGP